VIGFIGLPVEAGVCSVRMLEDQDPDADSRDPHFWELGVGPTPTSPTCGANGKGVPATTHDTNAAWRVMSDDHPCNANLNP
jgi:hypothetical protein